MSTARFVPETTHLDGDDAQKTLRRVKLSTLLKRSYKRFRLADGVSHARSLAYVIALVMVQGIIAVVGLATAFGGGEISGLIARSIEGIVPGAAGETLRTTLEQASSTGASHRYTALLVGLISAIVTGTTGFGQIERGANRLYGIERDRPTLRKYARAFGLTLTAGFAVTLAFFMLAVGQEIGDAIENSTVSTIWAVARWPIGVVLLIGAITAIFKWSPRRKQPGVSWMAVGGTVSVVGWVLVSVAMSVFLRISGSFGETYGPLAGLVALLLWSFFSAIAVFAGLAVAAQLEAERSGVSDPEDPTRIAGAVESDGEAATDVAPTGVAPSGVAAGQGSGAIDLRQRELTKRS